MDYEKKYNEALERAKAYHRNELAGSRKEMTEYIFPELRESEDERIRKAIVSLVYEMKGTYQSFAKVELDKMVAWLEKQKEQKPAEWSEEDEEMLEYIIGDVNDAKQLYTSQEAKDMADKEIVWLKSLRPQPKQERSEEDERILKGIIGKIDHDQTYGVSKDEMLNFLKKL